MLVQMICPNCGAKLEFDQSREFMFCQFCGQKIANIPEKVEIHQEVSGTVFHKIDKSGEPNLYINYATNNLSVCMITSIDGQGQKYVYLNNQTMSFHLLPGPHNVVMKIGKRYYNRIIYIPENNEPVRINAGFYGRAFINIDQPPYTIPEEKRYATPAAAEPTTGVCAILSFIFSFLYFTAPVGLVLGIIELAMYKKYNRKPGFARAGVIISSIETFYFLYIIFGL